jgi:phosphoribosylanthranilate isomerase
MWVMITGITHIEDALKACNQGADALGFLAEQVYASESISPEVAASITKNLPPACESVLVTHLVDVQEIIRLASIIGVTKIQLPGNTMPEDVIDIKNRLPYIKVIKSIHVIDDYCIESVKRYIGIVDAIELDTIDIATDRIGGTGKTHDWNISKKIVQEYQYKVPIILAGGLHSDNIESAIQTVKPFGVDVSSGVKDSKGILDSKKLASFIYKAKQVSCAC